MVCLFIVAGACWCCGMRGYGIWILWYLVLMVLCPYGDGSFDMMALWVYGIQVLGWYARFGLMVIRFKCVIDLGFYGLW